MAYPTADELVAESTVDELVELTADQQEGLRLTSIAAIEDHTGQRFESSVETRTLRGTRKRTLYLPARLEVLTGVTVLGVTLSDVVLGDDNDSVRLPETAGLGYYEQALRDAAGERWRGFHGEVAITGTWGWSVVPDAVHEALLLDMEEQALADRSELSSTIATYRKLGVRNVVQGNLRLTIGDEVVLSPRVQRLLRRYVWTTPGEAV